MVWFHRPTRGGSRNSSTPLVLVWLIVCATILSMLQAQRAESNVWKSIAVVGWDGHTTDMARTAVVANTKLKGQVGEETTTKDEERAFSNAAAATTSFVQCYELVKGAFALQTPQDEKASAKFFCQHPCVQHWHSQLLQQQSRLLQSQGDPEHDFLLSRNASWGKLLINSPGGVSSSYLMQRLRDKLNFTINSSRNVDNLKHSRATRLVATRRQASNFPSLLTLENYRRVVYLVGDPIHAIYSVFRRGWGTTHYANLCDRFRVQCRFLPAWRDNATAVFRTSAQRGYDAWTLQSQAEQWMQIQTLLHFGGVEGEAPENSANATKRVQAAQWGTLQPLVLSKDWPPILITNLETTVEAPAILAHFLGISTLSVHQRIRLANQTAEYRTARDRQRAAERQQVASMGGLDLYLRIERQWHEAVARNHLFYGIHMFCSTDDKSRVVVGA